MSLSITKELESSLRLAFAEAKARRHEHVTLEHLLYALLRDPIATRIPPRLWGPPPRAEAGAGAAPAGQPAQLPDGFDRDPEQTRAFQRVLERAAMQVPVERKGDHRRRLGPGGALPRARLARPLSFGESRE